MTFLFCDVHGTLIGGPHDRDVMLQALQDVLPEYVVQLVSCNVHNASRELGGVPVQDKADVIRKDLRGCVWIDDEDFLLRALARRGVTAVHVNHALEFLASIKRPVRENPRHNPEPYEFALNNGTMISISWDSSNLVYRGEIRSTQGVMTFVTEPLSLGRTAKHNDNPRAAETHMKLALEDLSAALQGYRGIATRFGSWSRAVAVAVVGTPRENPRRRRSFAALGKWMSTADSYVGIWDEPDAEPIPVLFEEHPRLLVGARKVARDRVKLTFSDGKSITVLSDTYLPTIARRRSRS